MPRHIEKKDPVKKAERNNKKVSSKSGLRRIPNQVRNSVNKRDQGKHKLQNLAALCSTHHRAIHEGVKNYRLANLLKAGLCPGFQSRSQIYHCKKQLASATIK